MSAKMEPYAGVERKNRASIYLLLIAVPIGSSTLVL